MKNLFLSLVIIYGLGIVSCTNLSNKAEEKSFVDESEKLLDQEEMIQMEEDTASSVNFKGLVDGYDTFGQLEIYEITSKNKVEFIDSIMPLDAFICVAAAFTDKSFDGTFFPHVVANKYITNGVKKQGYDCKISQSGCFAIDKDGNWYIGKPDEEKYQNAVNYFEQNLIIDNHKVNPKKAISYDSPLHWRCLAELNGHLCIIQTIIPISYPIFVEWIQKLGVKNALYLDMGGWSFGYVKDGNNYYDINPIGPKQDLHHDKIKNIKRDPHQTNWLVVREKP